MSGSEFHLHGPHDHALEHAAHGAHGGADHVAADRFSGRIAVTTTLLAAIALLTRRSWLQYAMYGVAASGVVLGGLALLHV